MGALVEGTDFFVSQAGPNIGLKTLVVSTVSTADDGDIIPLNLASFGANATLGVIGFKHSTQNSVVVQDQPTTTMSGSTLNLTFSGTGVTDNKARHFIVFAASTKNP